MSATKEEPPAKRQRMAQDSDTESSDEDIPDPKFSVGDIVIEEAYAADDNGNFWTVAFNITKRVYEDGSGIWKYSGLIKGAKDHAYAWNAPENALSKPKYNVGDKIGETKVKSIDVNDFNRVVYEVEEV